MGREMLSQRGFAAEDEQTSHGRHNASFLAADQSQGTVKFIIG